MGSNSLHNSSLFCYNPLFSSVITLFLLIFLYFPNCLIKSILCPILVSTLILLLSILRLGVSQQQIKHQSHPQFNNNIFESVSQFEFEFEFETLLQDSNTKIDQKTEPKSITHTKVPISLELELEPALESEQQVITVTKIDPRLEPEPITLIKDVIEPELEFSTLAKDLIEPVSIRLTKDVIESELEFSTLTKDLIEPESLTLTKDLIDPQLEPFTLTKDLIEPESLTLTKDLIDPQLELFTLTKDLIEPEPITLTKDLIIGLDSTTLTKDLIEPESTTVNKESVTKVESNQDEIDVDPHYNPTQLELDQTNKPEFYHKESFVEWDLWGPLEVIYEEEETQNDTFLRNVERYPSLSKYYPESDTVSDTDTESSSCSLDEEFEGMFEIALDYGVDLKNNNGNLLNKVNKEVEFDEEDNLIEIDISHSKEQNECVFSS